MGLLGFFGGQIRDLLTVGLLTRSGLFVSFGLFLKELLCLLSECLLSIVDLLLHILRNVFALSLLCDGLLGGGESGGSLRNLLVRRFVTGLGG
jgi:hypothetical protein